MKDFLKGLEMVSNEDPFFFLDNKTGFFMMYLVIITRFGRYLKPPFFFLIDLGRQLDRRNYGFCNCFALNFLYGRKPLLGTGRCINDCSGS